MVTGSDTRRSATELMLEFARRTGLSSDRPPRRYLWTDAFAVCNFLALAETTSAPFAELASRLLDQVHHVLGRHRPDDVRNGWISGLGEAEGEAHPTRGGLRIGKSLPERGPQEFADPELEWERDGQYFHYLTRWMHALDQVARRCARPEANLWARELAQVAHRAFVWAPTVDAPKRMFWKMSIDLTRPLVGSMGQHDPLDGLITYLQLRAHRDPSAEGPELTTEIREMRAMVERIELWTDDPLGLGGLLVDAYRLAQLRSDDEIDLLLPMLQAAAAGLKSYAGQQPLERPAPMRLAFRELGLAIGLHAIEGIKDAQWPGATPGSHHAGIRAALDALEEHRSLAGPIETFWRQPAQLHSQGWLAHEDINVVMLATSLVPRGYLDLG